MRKDRAYARGGINRCQPGARGGTYAPGALVALFLATAFIFANSVAIPYVNEEFAGKGRGLAMGISVFGQTIGGLFARSGSALALSIVLAQGMLRAEQKA
jgi:hypothetical protein